MILRADARTIPLCDRVVQCCVTSPPYFGLRDYSNDKQIGREQTLDEYIANLVVVFREVRRVLKDDGVLFLNLGDSYSSSSVRRAVSYGTSGKELASSINHDSSFENLCDECLWAYLNGKVHSSPRNVSKHHVLRDESNRVHTVELSDRLPTSDSFHPESHNDFSIQDFARSTIRVSEPSNVFQESTPREFSPQHREDSPRLDKVVLCQLCGQTFSSDVRGSERTMAYISDIVRNGDQSAVDKSGKVFSDLAYPYLDIAPPSKNLLGIPWRVAFALQADGWILRSEIIWHKTSCLPESVKDRCTRNHEHLFMLVKQPRYYYDADAIAEPIAESSRKRYTKVVETNEQFDPSRHKQNDGVQAPMEVMTRAAAGIIERGVRNKRTIWSISPQNYSGAHFAAYPEELPATCILASSRRGDVVLDPFSGTGTTGVAALHYARRYVGLDLNPAYIALATERLRQGSKKLADPSLF